MPKVKQFNREKVLETASSIFKQKGYNGTSIDEILKATGLSRSSLYDSFKDKHSLYLAALEYYHHQQVSNSYDTPDKKKLNGKEKIEVLFKQVVNHLVNYPDDNGCLMVNAAAEMSKQCEKTAHIVCNNRESIEQLLTTWLAEAEENHLLKLSNPPSSYGTFLYNTLCGLKVMSQTGASPDELNNVVKLSLHALN